jgi:hypothetical protein
VCYLAGTTALGHDRLRGHQVRTAAELLANHPADYGIAHLAKGVEPSYARVHGQDEPKDRDKGNFQKVCHSLLTRVQIINMHGTARPFQIKHMPGDLVVTALINKCCDAQHTGIAQGKCCAGATNRGVTDLT